MADFFNDSDAVEDNTQGTQRQRRPRPEKTPRQRRMLPKPLLRLILVAVGVIVLIVIIVVVVTTTRGGNETAQYQAYMKSVTDILKQSDAIGTNLSTLLTQPGDTSRKDVQSKLDEFVSQSETLETKAKALVPPESLVENDVAQFFVLVMTFRHEGLTNLKPALINALDTQDSDVVAEQISEALAYLTNSDFLYKTVFVKGATDLVKLKNIEGVTIPDSKFLEDPDMASQAEAQNIIAQLKSTGNLQAVHGVALTQVMEQPENKQIKDGQTYNLTSTDQLLFVVTVRNQGNMSEKNVPVVVTLGKKDDPDPQKITVNIPEIKPGKDGTATVEGLNPTGYGEVAVISIEVGPVAGEKVKDNNSIEAKVIFKL
jgi:hypothetical protein